MAVRLTERFIERLECPPESKDRLVFDAEQRGLGVRVVAAGSKSYLVQYSVAGKKHRVPLGSTSSISLAAARKAAAAVMGEVAKGANPAAVRKAEAEDTKVAALRERMTLGRLVSDWSRLHLSTRRPRYRQEATATIERVFKDWWNRPADRLARKDVNQVLDKLPASMARAAGAYGRACFGWGIKREAVPSNPFENVALQTTVKRDRVLTDEECARVWTAAAGMPAPFGPMVCMLLLTAQRRDEVGGMSWSELSADLATWTIPRERAKNGQPSIVPLSAPATELLERLEATRGSRKGLVFPGEGGKPFGGWSKAKAALDKASGVNDWRLHDLRRTAATGLQRLGVRLEVTEAVLNHVSGTRAGIVGIYQRHDWANEKRAALDGWAQHLSGIVGGAGERARRVA
jgi:integrase